MFIFNFSEFNLTNLLFSFILPIDPYKRGGDNINTQPPLTDNFVRALNYYRSNSGKTSKEIADHLGVSAPTVSNWGAGKHLPDMDTLQRLADFLQAPIEQFFHFTAIQPKSEAFTELISIAENLSEEDIKLLSFVALRLNK